MAKYLISIGYRKIAYVRGPHNLRTTILREDGFCRAASENSIPLDREYMVDGYFSFEGGVAAMEHLLGLSERPKAVFAANDLMAIGCVVTALQHGLRVPEDISIAGMDNIQSTQFVTPQLTTIDVPMIEMGKQAARHLFALIDGESVPEVTILPHSLIIRGTTAPQNPGGP